MNGYDISVVISDGFEDVSAEVKRNTPELEAELDLAGGIPVENGATFIPSVSKEGVISWTNDKDLPNPDPVNIMGAKGEKGDKGDRGERGLQGIQGIPGIQGEPGAPGQKGEKGEKGDRGEQGIQGAKGETGATGAKGSDGTPATHRWSGTTLYITSASGTSSANLKGDTGDPGQQGPAGANGKDGQPGKDGADGYSPVRGKDYWTDADKAEIKSYVDEAILGGEW